MAFMEPQGRDGVKGAVDFFVILFLGGRGVIVLREKRRKRTVATFHPRMCIVKGLA
jgi:hypothetical protein